MAEDHIKHHGSGAVGRGMHVFITVDHIGALAWLLPPLPNCPTCRLTGADLCADESERPQTVNIGNDMSRLTSDADLKNRVYTSPDQGGSRVSDLLDQSMSPTQVAKQAELEDKVDALRVKMRAAMVCVQAAKELQGGADA